MENCKIDEFCTISRDIRKMQNKLFALFVAMCTYMHFFELLQDKNICSPQMAQNLSFCLRPTQADELPGVFLFIFCQGQS